jgi:Domain of unknown function (DUF3516)
VNQPPSTPPAAGLAAATSPDPPAALAADASSRPTLGAHLPDGPLTDPNEILARFLDWVSATRFDLYPAQEKAIVERTDTSLLDEWESLLQPELHAREIAARLAAKDALRAHELLDDPRAFTARVRAEMHQLVRALAQRDWEEAAAGVRPGDPDDPAWAEAHWPPERFEAALAPFFTEYEEILFTPDARQAHWTVIDESAPRTWRIRQTLLDPAGDHLWHLEGVVDLTTGHSLEGPLVELRRIGE